MKQILDECVDVGGDLQSHYLDLVLLHRMTPVSHIILGTFGLNTILFKRKIFTIQNECDHQQLVS